MLLQRKCNSWETLATIVQYRTDLESRGEGVESGALEEDSGPDVAHVVEEAGDSEEGEEDEGIEKPERKSDVQYENMEELVVETREQIGTVLEVAAWKEEHGKQSYPGSARLVAWDPVFLNSSSQSTMTKSSSYDAVAGAGTIDAWVERTDTSTTDQNDEGRAKALVTIQSLTMIWSLERPKSSCVGTYMLVTLVATPG